MQSKIKQHEILIAVASAIFGLLIGPILDKVISPLFDTPTRAILVSLLFLSLLLIIAIVSTGIFIRRNETNSLKINHELENVNQRLGLTATFVQDPPNKSNGESYRAERQIIEKAEKEILILHYSRPRSKDEKTGKEKLETEAYRSEREKYMQAVLAKLRQHKKDKFFYRRVIQLPEGIQSPIGEQRLGRHWIEHLNAILQMQSEYISEAAYIKKSPLFLEQTFIMVDERYVLWRIGGKDPEYQVRYTEGALIFDDPNKELTPYLRNIFFKIEAHGQIVKKVPEI